MRNDVVREAMARYGIAKARAYKSEEPWLRKKHWTEEEYLALETNHLIEFNNGELEILPMPDYLHQTMARKLANVFEVYSESRKPGFVVCAPFRMKVPGQKYREPDVIYLFNENAGKFSNDLWTGADIAVEIVSPDGEKRDLIDKRVDYAAAGIGEYWIIQPKAGTVTVLKLVGTSYIDHGVFGPGERITSSLLNGFSFNVDSLFASRVPK